MANVQGIYKTGLKINLTYQAVGGLSAAAPVCKIYDEANASDTAKQSVLKSAMLANEKAGGRYLGYFTPDAAGAWTVCIQDKNGDGLVSKTYQVATQNLDSLGSTFLVTQSAINVATASDMLLAQSAINAATASDLLLLQSTVATKLAAETSDFKSALLVTQSAVNVAVASDLLLTQSAIAALVASDLLLTQSAINVNFASITSPAMVS